MCFIILGKKECVAWHRKKKIFVELYEEMFCAGYSDGKQDACLGKFNKKYSLIPINSQSNYIYVERRSFMTK